MSDKFNLVVMSMQIQSLKAKEVPLISPTPAPFCSFTTFLLYWFPPFKMTLIGARLNYMLRIKN